MQKKIIALAVAAVASTAAFAQSNVTVYGVADAYVGSFGTGSKGLSNSVVNAGTGLSGSRLGFKGVEDLGGGTKALFTFEFGTLALDNGTDNKINTTRQSFVGLTGAYGTVIAGRLQSLAYNHNAAYNPTFGTAVDTQASSIGGATNKTDATSSLAIGTAERLDNAVAYVAPAMGGVTLAAAHTTQAIGADGTAFSGAVRASEVSASYGNGPLAVGGVYRKVHELTGNGHNSYALGGSYDFGAAKVFANIGTGKAAKDGANTKSDLTSFGVVAPVSANGAVIASIATAKSDIGDTRATTSAVVYKHSLSKRTALYGGIAQATGNDNTGATLGGFTATAGGKVVGALAGINHSF